MWTGQSGATGASGATGIIGATGPVGLSGSQGLTGMVGVAGATGFSGPAGSPGPMGNSGSTGATGPAGPSGPPGDTGWSPWPLSPHHHHKIFPNWLCKDNDALRKLAANKNLNFNDHIQMSFKIVAARCCASTVYATRILLTPFVTLVDCGKLDESPSSSIIVVLLH